MDLSDKIGNLEPDAGPEVSPPIERVAHEMWRCRRCGKWSHAKRRPNSHQAVKVLEEEPGAYRKSVMVRCGPFDRFVAEMNDPTTTPDYPDFFGRPIFGTEQEWSADPNEGIPF